MDAPNKDNPTEGDEEQQELMKAIDCNEPKQQFHSKNLYKGLNSPASPSRIFLIWLAFVILCNIFTPFGHEVTQELTHAKYWPPADIVLKNIDNHNRVVVAMTDFEYVKLADNFLASLEANGVRNFVVITLDYESYLLLNQAYPGHVVPPMPTKPQVQAADFYVSRGYFEDIVGSRINMLHAFLEAGYTIFYSDIDSVWKTNVLNKVDDALNNTPHLNPGAIDGFFTDDTRPDNEKQISAAHMYLKSTSATRLFLEHWYHNRRGVFLGDYRQSLNQLIKNTLTESDKNFLSMGFDGATMDSIVGSTEDFPPGWVFFGTTYSPPSMSDTERNNVAIVHNNFENSIPKKINLFKREGLWNPSGRLPTIAARKNEN